MEVEVVLLLLLKGFSLLKKDGPSISIKRGSKKHPRLLLVSSAAAIQLLLQDTLMLVDVVIIVCGYTEWLLGSQVDEKLTAQGLWPSCSTTKWRS